MIPSSSSYQRRVTREVKVGHVGIGGANPVRVQSMITSDTMDTEACIRQTLDLAAVQCEIVRITAPTVKDAANLEHIVKGLRARGCDVPIVADIHFKPEAAMEAAKWVEKIRINPGNYADSKKFQILEYTDAQYAEELERIRERFTPLVRFCKERGVAMRIGTNHGSLSDRIMNRYGDSPLGMVESALEVAQIARSVARALLLDEDVTEAVALAHDLGHTCFGHAGEDALAAAMQPYGGFSHNEQTFRIVTQAESQGMKAVIPSRRNRKIKRDDDQDLYKLRHLVENAFLHLKRWRGIATRYAKNSSSFLAAVPIRCIALWASLS